MRFTIIVKATEDSEAGVMPTEGLIAGYTMIQVRSREEAMEWARRFPNPAVDHGKAEIEVRQLFELDDFEQGPAVERFRELDLPGQGEEARKP